MADWRYPFNPGLNQQATLPSGFGPPNQSSQIQGAIGSFMDPILAKILQQQATERAQNINEKLITLGEAYKPGATTAPTAPGAAPGAAPAAAPIVPTSAGGATTVGSPAGDDPGGQQARGTTTVQEPVLRAARAAISTTESGSPEGNYKAVGPPVTRKDGSVDRAYGFTQVMGSNVGPWTEEHFGQRLNPTQFLNNPAAQEAVFRGEFGKYLEKYGTIEDAASKWFTGRPYDQAAKAGASDGYNTVQQYVAKVKQALGTQAPAPQGAPQTAFSPAVAPAPTPQAAAAVTPPVGPAGAAPYAPAYMNAATGGGIAPNDPRVNPAIQGRPAPGRPAPQAGPAPQAQAPQQAMPQEQTQQGQAEAQQQEVIQNVGQGTQQLQQRLEAERQAGQRTRVASLDPGAGISPALPNIGLGEGMPGMGGGPGGPPMAPQAAIDPSVPAPRMVPTTREPPPPPPPAPGSPAAAPGGDTAGPQPPPAPRPAVAPPIQVAQAQIIPPTVTDQRAQRPISNEQARELLRMARTPEEVAAVAQHIMKTREAPAMVPNRFRLENGFWIDSLTGETKAAGPRAVDTKGRDTVEVEGPGGTKRRMQWNPATERYDIPVDGGPAPTGPAPPTKEQFEQEYKLRDKFESNPETRRYAVATNSYGQMRSSANSGNGVGDISLIYQYMKMLDPDTGVREGEYANAASTGGVPDRIVNWYNKAVSGERLSDKQRKDFVDEAGRLLQVRHGNVAKEAEKVRRNATAYGLSPDRVAQIEDYKFEPWAAPTGPDGRPRNDPGGTDPDRAATAPGTPSNPIPIPDDPKAAQKTLRAMPSKKWFIMPDGTVSQKP